MIGTKLCYLGSPVKYDSDLLYYFENEIIIPALEISGGMQAECDIVLPVMYVSGALAADGIITIPAMMISGKMRDSIDGLLSIHVLSIDCEIVISSRFAGELEIPAAVVTGDMQAECTLILQQLRIEGLLQAYGVVSAGIELPCIEISGSMLMVVSIAGSIVLPATNIAGTVTLDSTASIIGEFNITALTISGILISSLEYVYGSEDDVVLRYTASRRHL